MTLGFQYSDSSGIAAYGAGVYTVDGNITLVNSRVNSNSILSNGSESFVTDSFGGGIYSAHGDVTLINSEVSDNPVDSEDFDPGIFPATARAWGGRIYNGSRNTRLINSLVSHNTVSAKTDSYDSTSDAREGVYGNTVLENSVLWGNKEIENVNGIIATDFNEHES